VTGVPKSDLQSAFNRIFDHGKDIIPDFGNASDAPPTIESVRTQAQEKGLSETGIASRAVSVSSVAMELAKRIFDRLDDKTVMLIGAGKMGDLVARHLQRNGVQSLMVTNRTFDRAVELAGFGERRAAAEYGTGIARAVRMKNYRGRESI